MTNNAENEPHTVEEDFEHFLSTNGFRKHCTLDEIARMWLAYKSAWEPNHPQQRNAVIVTDEMVDNALDIWFSDEWREDLYGAVERYRQDMRAALEATVLQDRADAMRLDWLMKNSWLGVGAYYFSPVRTTTGETVREAIDAARQRNWS